MRESKPLEFRLSSALSSFYVYIAASTFNIFHFILHWFAHVLHISLAEMLRLTYLSNSFRATCELQGVRCRNNHRNSIPRSICINYRSKNAIFSVCGSQDMTWRRFWTFIEACDHTTTWEVLRFLEHKAFYPHQGYDLGARLVLK